MQEGMDSPTPQLQKTPQKTPQRKRALLLLNPHSRQGQNNRYPSIRYLQSLGLTIIEEEVENPQHLSQVIRQYRDRVDLAIVGGGDGTLNAAIEGLLDAQLPLGILPLGTANDLARTLGIPTTLAGACQAIAAGQIRWIDLGWVNGQYFFNVASLGLSVQIAHQLSKEAKRRWGVLAYALTALRVMWQSRPFRARISCNGETIKVHTSQIAIGNGRYFGGGMTIVQDATIDDRRLDLCSLEVRHWWQILAIFPSLWRGGKLNPQWLRRIEGEEIDVYTRKPHAINTDGEITTYTPAKFKVIPRALAVFVPRLSR
jgi:diacylglycerol kinase (ATP)